MNRQRQNTVTFKGLLEQTAAANAGRLMHRARTANRLAKTVRGKARAAAYRVKTNALVTLKKRFPEQVELRTDVRQPEMVVVAVAHARFGLHAPAQNFIAWEGSR
ncbi:MAG TPA: hypothetical protein VGO91_09095 [Pyrinomonadaceae bacterium]|jgi:hypothetical protein|nr:hypothetical protein [Pyrinomonadaceae bacterium]